MLGETDVNGSFDAWGLGFGYIYNSKAQQLDILRSIDKKPLLKLKVDYHSSLTIRDFVVNLDKAAQIYSLMLSNRKTVDLTDLVDENQIKKILKGAARLSRYSCELSNEDYVRFANRFVRHYGLKYIEIKKIPGPEPQKDVFTGKLKTRRDNTASAISSTLHGIVRDLSDRTIQDLVIVEYESINQRDAQNLLSASTNLATISRILDKHYSPHKRLAKYNGIKNSDLINLK